MSQSTQTTVVWIIVALLISPMFALAEPVDTRQFGLINNYMTAADVQRRLGAPDQVVEDTPVVGTVRGVGKDPQPIRAVRIIQKTQWYYRGDSTTLPTWIAFEDGRVVRKWKGR